MNFGLAFVILFVAIIQCSYSTAQQDNQRCNRACSREYNPLCGTLLDRDGRAIRCTFANQCLLDLRRCLTKESKSQTMVFW